MSNLTNPLVTPSQLTQSQSQSQLPPEIQDSIRFYTARLTQAAGILLRLPQDVTAKANVLLFRYWVVDGMGGVEGWEFSDISASVLYLTAKMSSSPRSLRSITNTYAFLLSSLGSTYLSSSTPPTSPDATTYYLSESAYASQKTIMLNLEGQILNALGFQTHVALPHALAITYLQTLDVFNLPSTSNSKSSSKPKDKSKTPGQLLAHRTIAHLNTALLSPQMLYLTHQPPALATAAIYLAAREVGVKLPECEWWEVFDCEREELGFLVVAMGSLGGWVEVVRERWGAERGFLRRVNVRGLVEGGGGKEEEDEESEMARMLDRRVEA
ncbi:hypothetical protein VTL71DRAFT_2881 [Oculimacula yallundae]|uniref:Cyclin n=1 Tax=Oculimacula yallundae TaxID=86028 RepID=A0ABR4C5J4_9HELO